MRLTDRFWLDARDAARSLRRAPGFTSAAIVMLTLGIGASTAVFTVISAVLLRPLPYRDAGQLVMVWQEYVNRGWGIVGVSHANLVAMRDQSQTLDALEGFQPYTASMAEGDDQERVAATRITPGLFPMLGIAPAAGRLFTSADARGGAERVAIISDGLWRRRFGADAGVLGRPTLLDGVPHRIVGIIRAGAAFPPRFRMTLASSPQTMPAVDVWIPLALDPDAGRVGFRNTLAIGRLAAGATLDMARAEAPALAAALLREFPGPANTGLSLAFVPLTEQMTGDVRRPLLLLFGAVGFVVLIACANVASMLVARSAMRQAETALRAALGASRGRLIRSALAESVVLAGVSAVLGLLLAVALTSTLAATIAARVPQFEGVTLNVSLLAFAALVATIVTVLFGAGPALYASTLGQRHWTLGSSKGTVGPSASPTMRRALLAGEAALALVLIVGAGLLARSFYRLVSVDAGFDSADRLAVGLVLPEALGSTDDQRRSTYESLVERVAAIPGVEALGVASSLPLTGDVGTGGLAIEGRDVPPSGERPHAAQRQVDPGYFEVMGMTIVRGRAFTANDRPGAAQVAIVNETAARTFWPRGDPIGQRIRPDGFGDDFWLTIVGVVRDVRYAALSAAAGPEVYVPYAFAPARALHIVMRSSTPAPLLSASVRREVRQLDARLPALWISTLDDLVAESVAESRLLLVLLGLFAGFGLVVSAGGIYGVTSYLVAHRRQDLAVRLALGASPTRLIGWMLTESIIPVTVGVAIGLGVTTGLSPLLTQHLFEVSPSDPLTLAAAPALLIAATLAACYSPARHAAGVDPLAALRAE